MMARPPAPAGSKGSTNSPSTSPTASIPQPSGMLSRGAAAKASPAAARNTRAAGTCASAAGTKGPGSSGGGARNSQAKGGRGAGRSADKGRGGGGDDQIRAQPPGPGYRRGEKEFGSSLCFFCAHPQHCLDACGRREHPGHAEHGGDEHIDQPGPAARHEPGDEFLQRRHAGHGLGNQGAESPGHGTQCRGPDTPSGQGGALQAPRQADERGSSGSGALPAVALGRRLAPTSRRCRISTAVPPRTNAAVLSTSSGNRSGLVNGRERWPQPMGDSSDQLPEERPIIG